MTTDTQLTFASFDSRYELLSSASEAWHLQRALDQIVREQLPRLLAEYLLPQVDPDHAVYRIRQIHVDLAIHRGALEGGQLPRLWAQQLIRHIFHELRYGNSDNVARFATHAEFVAAFIAELLRGKAWHSWLYQEFAPLRHLSVGDAVTELLSARPAFFIGVSRYLRRQGLSEMLLCALDERQAKRILDALRQATTATSPSLEPLLALSRRALEAPAAVLAAAPSPGKRRLAWLLHMTYGPGGDPELAAAVQLGNHLALFQQLLLELSAGQRAALAQAIRQDPSAGVAPLLMRWLARQRATDFPAELQLPPLSAGLRTELIQLVSYYRDTRRGSEYLRRLLELLLPAVPGAALGSARQPKPEQRPLPAQATTEEAFEFTSAFAGFSLVLMTIKEMRLDRRLTMAQLRHCLQQMIDPSLRRLCELDPIWGALLPENEPLQPMPAWPEIDAACLMGLAPDRQSAIRDRQGPDSWGALILHRFARRLPGLEASSIAYLCQQFLQRAGHIRVTPKSVTVTMASIPLGVVLKMAGMSGWQGQLPWLAQRELVIDIPAG